MTPSPGGAYRVVSSQRVLAQLREWARRAERLGMNQEYLAVLRNVWQRLADDPLGWGEPEYRLRVLGLLMRHGAHSFLHVYYGVDGQRRIVYAMDFRLGPSHPLSQGP